jgi:hypothetical protein
VVGPGDLALQAVVEVVVEVVVKTTKLHKE